jgi:NADPH2:quinone reductase
MRAWQVTALGEPIDVLRLAEVSEPVPGPGQVSVRVRAAAANFPDVLMARGHYQVRPPLPFTPGIEACGDVVAVGEGVTHVAVGDRVLGGAEIPTGSFADVTLMSGTDTFRAPASLDDAAAASLHLAYQTGWFGLHRRARLQAGETLLVHAAAGGVGSAAVQLGKAAGARVIAVVGSAEKAEVATVLGADVVVDRTHEDFVSVVKDVTGGRGADVVYDPVGGAAYTGSTRCIAFEGRIVVVGFTSGEIPSPALSHALVKNYSIVGLHWGLYRTLGVDLVHEAYADLVRLSDEGAISPLVSERIALDAVPDALQRLAAGTTTGRVVYVA